jgi:hypothetical protein
MDEMVLVKDLPPTLVEDVFRALGFFTIAFLRVDETADDGLPDLLGSGVLVSVGTTRAILTAHHVAQRLPTSGRITLFLGRTTQPHSVDAAGIVTVKVARGTCESVGPDLAVVLLAPQIAGAIAAKKSFYNLESRRDKLLNDPPNLRDGAWFAQGFLAERTTVAPDPVEPGFTKYFYNFTGVGGPDTCEQIADHDYFDFPVSHEARSEAPVSWGGMSGGGLWQVPIKKQPDGLTHLPPLLSGIMFYQQPTTETTCGVRGHGRRSIYEEAYRVIRNREP